jgi:hypothetical protein
MRSRCGDETVPRFWVLAGVAAVSSWPASRWLAVESEYQQRNDTGEEPGALPNHLNRKEILPEHRAARDPRRNFAKVSLPHPVTHARHPDGPCDDLVT